MPLEGDGFVPGSVFTSAFRDPSRFAFVPALEACFDEVLAELESLEPRDFIESPDSLTTIRDGYNETGWRYFDLFGEQGDFEANRNRCPASARAAAAVPGMVNAGFSLFEPGTHLYPHSGEMPGILRCHLPILVPNGDQGLRFGSETRVWELGRCVIFDDTIEHDAWNRGDGDRVVLLVTFAR